MKVRDQPVDATDGGGRTDENVRLAAERVNRTVQVGGRLEGPHAGRADRPHVITPRPHGVQLLGRVARDLAPFLVHHVLRWIFVAHRAERAGTDMQKHVRHFDAAGPQRVEQVGGEVQTRRGGRDRAARLRVHGLVPGDVARFVGALDIRRQRHMAVLLDRAGHIAIRVQAHDARATGRRVHDFDAEVGGDRDHAARAQFATRVNHRFVVVTIDRPEQQDLRRTAAFPMPQQSRAEHLGGVHHDRVAGRNHVGDVAERAMGDAAVAPVDHEQTARIARLDRTLRDALLRELVVIVGRAAALVGRRIDGVRHCSHGSAERQSNRSCNATVGPDFVPQRTMNPVFRAVFF